MFNMQSNFQNGAGNAMIIALGAVFAFSEHSPIRRVWLDALLQRPRILHAECLPPDGTGNCDSSLEAGKRSAPL